MFCKFCNFFAFFKRQRLQTSRGETKTAAHSPDSVSRPSKKGPGWRSPLCHPGQTHMFSADNISTYPTAVSQRFNGVCLFLLKGHFYPPPHSSIKAKEAAVLIRLPLCGVLAPFTIKLRLYPLLEMIFSIYSFIQNIIKATIAFFRTLLVLPTLKNACLILQKGLW